MIPLQLFPYTTQSKKKMDWGTFLNKAKEIGPWIISLIALLQVWVVAIWKNFRHPEIDVFESLNIEVGHANFGPSIALSGTLRCRRKDAFIKKIYLTIRSGDDGATRHLHWKAFRDIETTVGKSDEVKLQPAKSFLLLTEKAQDFNIFFSDNEWQTKIESKISGLLNEWREHESKSDKPSEFSRSTYGTDMWTLLDRSFSWKACEYMLSMKIETSRPDKIFERTWKFFLTDENINSLRLNSIMMVQALSGQNVTFNFAHAPYQQA